MYPDRYNEITNALKNKGVDQPCPRCQSSTFTIVGESEISVKQSNSGALSSGSKMSIPTVVIACGNCGFISQYAQVALGIYPPKEQLGILGRAIKR